MQRSACKSTDERERTIEEFLPWIKHLAFKLSKGVQHDVSNTDDLISAGILGLLEAMEKYDRGMGTKLHSFAYMRVRGAMMDELRKKDWFPRSARTKAKKIGGAIGKLEKELGRCPTEEEVAQELKLCLEDYRRLITGFGNLTVVSIDEISEALGIHTEGTVSFIVEDGDSPERLVEQNEVADILGSAVERLTEKQKNVVGHYYYEDRNMREIAETLGITQARISQIHSQAILSLRTHVQKLLHR